MKRRGPLCRRAHPRRRKPERRERAANRRHRGLKISDVAEKIVMPAPHETAQSKPRMNTDRDHHNTSCLTSTFGFNRVELFLIRVHRCVSVVDPHPPSCFLGTFPPTAYEPTDTSHGKIWMNTDRDWESTIQVLTPFLRNAGTSSVMQGMFPYDRIVVL